MVFIGPHPSSSRKFLIPADDIAHVWTHSAAQPGLLIMLVSMSVARELVNIVITNMEPGAEHRADGKRVFCVKFLEPHLIKYIFTVSTFKL